MEAAVQGSFPNTGPVERLPPSDSASGARAAARIDLIQHLRDSRGEPFIVRGCKNAVPEPRSVSRVRLDPDNRATAIRYAVRELITRNRRSTLNLSPLHALAVQEVGDHPSKPH
jgi:hypothetical protein